MPLKYDSIFALVKGFILLKGTVIHICVELNHRTELEISKVKLKSTGTLASANRPCMNVNPIKASGLLCTQNCPAQIHF